MAKRSIDRPQTSTIQPKDDLVLDYDEQGRLVEQYTTFDELMITSGGLVKPAAQQMAEVDRDPLQGSIKQSFAKYDKKSDKFIENYTHGPVTELLRLILKNSVLTKNDTNIKQNTYGNNFLINYHSHYFPMPVSLQEYVTSCEITNSKNSPYESCNLELTITDLSLAKAIFAGDDGHPQPGGWILIRNRYSKDGPNITEDLTNSIKGFNINYEYERRNQCPAIFFGVVSNINWNIVPDDTGNFLCKITVLVNSFIHNLIYGEFIIAENGTKTHVEDVAGGSLEALKNADAETLQAQIDAKALRAKGQIAKFEGLPFVFNQSDWQAFLSQQLAWLVGEGLFNIDVKVKDLESEAGYKIIQEKAKLPIGYVLYNMINKLSYMYLPTSLLAEPMDTEVFRDISERLFNSYSFSTQDEFGETYSEIELLLKTFILKGVKEKVDKSVLLLYVQGFMGLLGYATGENINFVDPRNPNYPIFGYEELDNLNVAQKEFVTRTNNYANIVFRQEDPNTLQISQTRGVLQPTRDFQATDDLARLEQELIDIIEKSPYEIIAPLRLGDVLHVATTRNHVPFDHELYPAMPWREIRDFELTKFTNVYSGSQNIWSLLKATFQPDDEIFELYPCLIPMTDSLYKMRSEKSINDAQIKQIEDEILNFGYTGPLRSSLNAGNRLWNLIGCIPTIIYRFKPMNPNHIINKEYINDYNRRLLEDKKLFRKRPEMKWNPVSEGRFKDTEYYTEDPIIQSNTTKNQSGVDVKNVINRKQFVSEFRDNSYGKPHKLKYFAYDEKGKSIDFFSAQTDVDATLKRDYFKTKQEKVAEQFGGNASGGETWENTYPPGKTLDGYPDVYLPSYINNNEIQQITFNQSDVARINSTYVNAENTKTMNSALKYFVISPGLVEAESTLMYGLRKYENTYPFMRITTSEQENVRESFDKAIVDLIKSGKKTVEELSTDDTLLALATQTPINSNSIIRRTSIMNERLYMMIGDDQKYFNGTARIIGNLLSDEIKPGMWVEMSLDNSIDKPELRLRNTQTDNQSNLLLAYIDSLTTTWSVDQENGLVVNETLLSFSRGSFGNLMPNFPTIKYFGQNPAEILKQYVETELPRLNPIKVAEGSTLQDSSYKPTSKTLKLKNNPFAEIIETTPPQTLKPDQLKQLVSANLKKGKITQTEADALLVLDPPIIPGDTYDKLKATYDTLTDEEKALIKSTIKQQLP